MEPWSYEFAGRLEEHTFDSDVLKGNVLEDPYQRPLWVYIPPGYEDDPERRFPTVYAIQGLTGQLDMWRNRSPFRWNFPELADRGIASGEIPPCVVVYVDCWTSLGGSQFLDSPGTGRYLTYLCDEVVPWVDARYRTMAEREHRGIAGKSSGGYGAMVVPMLRPDVFGALASHAGDALFERLGDLGVDDVGIGAAVAGAHRDHRRVDRRILSNAEVDAGYGHIRLEENRKLVL
jgi:enterochelin esterase-like enzyme